MSQYIGMECSSYSQLVENQDRVYLFILHSKSLLVCLLIIYNYGLLSKLSHIRYDFHLSLSSNHETENRLFFTISNYVSRFR
jgi:hypothetical protein